MDKEAAPNTFVIPRQKSQLNLAIFVFGAILLVIVIFLYFQNQQLKQELITLKSVPSNQISVLPSPVASAEVDPTASWKTYEIPDKLSFKYPANLEVKEADKEFINISPVQRSSDLDVYFSIDARLQNNYVNYNQAITAIKQDMINPIVTNVENGVKITGTAGPGYGAGQPITVALFRFNNGAISFETTLTSVHSTPEFKLLFNQILSTFKFITKVNHPEALNQYCAGPNNLLCPTGYACKLKVLYKSEFGGNCVSESETSP